METITDRMMNLNGERQQDFSILVKVFSKREHGRKKVLHVSHVDIKTGKTDPRNIRYEEYIFPVLFFGPVGKIITIERNVFCINVLKVMNIPVEVTP